MAAAVIAGGRPALPATAMPQLLRDAAKRESEGLLNNNNNKNILEEEGGYAIRFEDCTGPETSIK